MRRALLLVLAAGLLSACGSDEDDSANDAGVADDPALVVPEAETAAVIDPEPAEGAILEMTTIAALGVELPFPIPGEIPVPSDAEYIGESPNAAPYDSAQFTTAMDAELLKSELRDFADANDARFDEAIEQVTYITEIDGARYNVYVWVLTSEGATILEAGIIMSPE